jgi:hypothetical protein
LTSAATSARTASLLGDFALQVAQGAGLDPLEETQVADQPRLELVDGGRGRLQAEALVGVPLVVRHGGRLGGEGLGDAEGALRRPDLLGRRDEPVHHGADLVGQLDVERRQVAVDALHPGGEPLEDAAHLTGRGASLEEVGLEAASELLVVGPLLLQGHLIPDLARRRACRKRRAGGDGLVALR